MARRRRAHLNVYTALYGFTGALDEPGEANVRPAFISTAVSTWRTVNAGILKPLSSTERAWVDFADAGPNFETVCYRYQARWAGNQPVCHKAYTQCSLCQGSAESAQGIHHRH